MKQLKFLMAIGLFVFAVVAAQAQNQRGGQPRQMSAKEITTMMTEKLGLSSDQQTKVLALNTKYESLFQHQGGPRGPRPEGMRRDSTASRPQMTDAQKAAMQQRIQQRKEYETQLKAILTDSQYQTYQQMHQRRGGRGNGQGRPTPPSNDSNNN